MPRSSANQGKSGKRSGREATAEADRSVAFPGYRHSHAKSNPRDANVKIVSTFRRQI
jgi:hypothetical protein